MDFLPSLRKTLPTGRRGQQQKVVLEGYYAALAAQGVHMGGRDLDGVKPWPIERAVSEALRRVVYVYAAVDAIAGAASRLPFGERDGDDNAMRGGGTAVRKPDYRTPLGRTMNRKANPLESGSIFRYRLSGQVLLSNRGAFVQKTRNRRDDVVRLDLLPPGRTRPVPGTGANLVSHFELTGKDGYTKTNLSVEQVAWVRNPSLLDPFGASTPLDAAGLSIELDHAARLYNRQFMANDGRPGGILGVEADTDELDMDRIESRFGKGPVEAGKLTVVGGELSYVDTAKTPRDAQYVQASQISKTEILIAFKCPESIIGNATGKTFANADAEAESFWLHAMLPHLNTIASAFDDDPDDDREPFIDVSSVEALGRAAARRRSEARDELKAGLITVDEYREVAERDPFGVPASRCLWLPAGGTPVAVVDGDQEALRALVAPAVAVAQPAGTPDSNTLGGGTAQQALPSGSQTAAAVESTASGAPGTTGTAAPRAIAPPPPPPSVEPAAEQRKAMPTTDLVRCPGCGDVVEFDADNGWQRLDGSVSHDEGLPDVWGQTHSDCLTPPASLKKLRPAPGDDGDGDGERGRDRLEVAIADALLALTRRQTEVAVARVNSPKAKKNTRHWQAEGPHDLRHDESKGLDPAYVVDAARWREEAERVVELLVVPAAEQAADALQDELGGGGEKALASAASRLVRRNAARVVRFVGDSAARQAVMLQETLAALDAPGASVPDLARAVREYGEGQAGWVAGLAVQAATATVEGARDAVAGMLDTPISRTWRTKKDPQVRASHKNTEGQTIAKGERFKVGTDEAGYVEMEYPGDPTAPVGETANCRCRVQYRRTMDVTDDEDDG